MSHPCLNHRGFAVYTYRDYVIFVFLAIIPASFGEKKKSKDFNRMVLAALSSVAQLDAPSDWRSLSCQDTITR